MSQLVKAIYQNGVLQPLDPLDLNEDDLVTVSIEHVARSGQEVPDDYFPLIATMGIPALLGRRYAQSSPNSLIR